MVSDLSAVVTGASSGIGKAIALAIASAGGSLCLVGRDRDRLMAVAESCLLTARSVLAFQADLNNDYALEELTRYVEREFKSFNTLIHCAGIVTVGHFEKISVAQLDLMYRTNVRAPYTLTQALLPLLKTQKGQIVFINSSQGLQASAKNAAYASTKHALRAIADSLRHEINAEGIRVLSIYPGRTASPAMESLYKAENQSYRPELLLQTGDVAQAVINALQLPRSAEVTNIEMRPLIKSY